MKELIYGAYDLHVHSAPDICERRMDDIEMAERIVTAGMGGYAIKSHFFCTAERATLINKMFPQCEAIGAITLNNSVGGINSTAVEVAARAGAKIVWFPTCDAANEQEYTFSGDKSKKLPYWAHISLQLKEEGIADLPISITNEDGSLKTEVLNVLDVIKRHEIILATGHCSPTESLKLVKTAADKGVTNIIVTHADFPSTYFTMEQQKELVSHGAYIEHCYTTYATGKVEFEETLSQIRTIGSDHVILSTDLGQKTAKYPDEGLLDFSNRLYENGFSEKDIHKMIVDNPRKLLGKKVS